VRAPSPKTRRAALAAFVLIAAAALMMGARGPDDDWMFGHCEEDLGDVLEGCQNWEPCPDVDDEFSDACVASCLLMLCPDQTKCTGLDPVFCVPCEDMQGALFWRNAGHADAQCEYEVRVASPTLENWEAEMRVYDACFPAHVEEHCPALAGTDWLARYDAVINYPRKRTTPPRAPGSRAPCTMFR